MKISVVTPSIRPLGLEITQKSLENQTLNDFEWLVELSLTNGKSDLNAAYNRALKRAKGELIVSLQDWIRIPEDGLQQFWNAYKSEPAFYTAPVAKQSSEDPSLRYDWRAERERDCNWQEWEIDWGAAPLEYLQKIGGFDEKLDEYWGFDNVNVGLRADMAGYKFYNLPNNVAIARDHNSFMPHPHQSKRNPAFHNMRLDAIRRGEKVDYLSK